MFNRTISGVAAKAVCLGVVALTPGATLVATPAFAIPTTLTATGTVTYVGALQNSTSIPTPTGSIRVGDAYTVSATFDPSQALVSSLYDADPTINIYSLPGTTVTYSIGSYSQTFRPLYDFNSTVQLWNNDISIGSPIDSQSFSFFNYNVMPTSSLPFDLGVGRQSVSLDLFAFDFTATARTNDFINQLAPLSAFNSKSFSFGQLNANTALFVYVQGNVATETLSAAVPEVSTWAMLVVGIGAVGYAVRRRKVTTRVSTLPDSLSRYG